jgi:hypothetical protein
MEITVHEGGPVYKGSGPTIATIKYAATFIGKSGPSGTGEFYSGVRPGMQGTAAHKIWSTQHESWSFSVGGAWLSCDREEIQLDEPEGPRPASPVRYVAEFTAEAWVRDEAIEVDPEGPTEWDCTTYATTGKACNSAGERTLLAYLADVAEWRHESLTDGGVTDNDDLFIHDPNAPEWIRTWHGPFTIRVREEAPS